MNSFRLRMRPLLLLAAIAMALVVASGIAWAATIQCPNQPDSYWDCVGTDEADVMYGTADEDHMGGGLWGADTLYGRGGNDQLGGWKGSDDVYGGGGDDEISNGESDSWFGADENYGGRGNDFILGGYGPELHSGGPGDDTIVDYKRPRVDKAYADVFRCGDGYDEVTYDEGDRVAADCEVVQKHIY